MSQRTVNIPYLARVEGEGALEIRLRDRSVSDVRLRIFEPPRLFEPILAGRRFTEAPDITARICGICPVAHQMSSCNAVEAACGITVTEPIRRLRRLLYCGEYIESHVLHAFLLHAPDFLGLEDAIQIARLHRDLVEKALRLKKIGNDIVAVVGGREIHPINVRIGGFYRAPTAEEIRSLVEPLKWACDAAEELATWTGTLDFPDFEQPYEFVALRHPKEYPLHEGRIVSSKGIDIPVEDFEDTFVEEHVKHSTALHSKVRGRGAYHVGPLARYNLNQSVLPERARKAARSAGLGTLCLNPFKSIVVRMVETVFACEEALRIAQSYEPPDSPCVAVEPRAGTGCGCSEAPRGILYHRYRIDADGVIQEARITPPTAQNQATIESDLRALLPGIVDAPPDILARQCENAVRNYDPCISCSAHFLRVSVTRE